MNFFSQPCVAPSESGRMGAKQGHATSAAFAKDCSGPKKNPFRPWRLYPDSVGAWREPFSKPNPATAQPATPKIIFSNQKRSPSRPWRLYPDSVGALRESSAFSLTEVVIAMGVAAVAFTSIMGLFPLGLNMSKESYESTQAALIAQTLMADLKDALSSKDSAGNYAKLIQISGDTFNFTSANYTNITMNGNQSTTFYLAYDVAPRINSIGQPLMARPCAFSTGSSAFYDGGSKINGAFAVAKVTISKTFFYGTSSANPQKIDVWVETPGNLSSTNRTQFLFTGVIPQN